VSSDINAVLNYQPVIKAALDKFIRQQESLPGGGLGWNKDIAERLQVYALNGKLLRGCLICYSYALESDAAPTEAVLNAAVTLELIHTALLIHDDLIDRDDLRRGQPALHRQYSQWADKRQLADPQRFGSNMALCAGDTALFWALGLLCAPANASAADTAIAKLFSQALTAVCAGQMEDIYMGMADVHPTKRAIYAVMRSKTAVYSVALPLAVGAVLAGQPAPIQRLLHAIGMDAGLIFQIRDDELGVLGQSSILGKPVGADIREGKKTLPYYYLLQATDSKEKRYLSTVFGNIEASQTDIARVQAILRRHNIPQYVKQDIARLEARANRRIDRLALNQTAQDKLRRLVAFCAARQA
jgi:geranylgeranyl diphosphate synthase type I